MDLGISGKVAIVSASSQGLGKACAQALAAAGARVAILSRRPAELEKVAAEIGAAASVGCDLADAESIAAAVAHVCERLGPVTILVNNCGGPPPGTFDSIAQEQWDHAYQQVFLSTLRMTRAVLPMMREARWGRIVNILSTSVEQPIPGLIISNAFRPALAGWAKTLATELAPEGILVNSVCPGRIQTARAQSVDEMISQRTGQPIEAIRAQHSAHVPLKRYGQPNEFGQVVAFLASERASYVTGSVIRVDGGAVVGL